MTNIVIFCSENLIFSAPTSAGKSIVADLLLLRPLLLEKKDGDEEEIINQCERPFSVYIVPFLSLISEKERKISAVLKELDLSYISIHSHKRPIISTTEPPDVILCTIQKAN